MNNKNETVFRILGVLGMILGILICITIVGLIFGIPLIIGSNKYFELAKQSEEKVLADISNVTLWGVVYSILIFPIGLIALIPIFNLKDRSTNDTKNTDNVKKDDMDIKIEKIEKLNKMKEQGIINEEDFNIAKRKILEK